MEVLLNLLSPAMLELLSLFLLHSLWIGSLAGGGAWLSLVILKNASARIRCNLLLMWLGAIPVLSIVIAARQSQSLHEKPRAITAEQNYATANDARQLDIARSDSDDGPSSQMPPWKSESLTQSTWSESNPKPGNAENMPAKVSMHPQLHRQLNRPPEQLALASGSREWARSRFSFMIVVAWMVGVTMLCLRMLVDWLQLRRWIYHSVVADQSLVALVASLRVKLQIKQWVDVRLVQTIAEPMAVGVLRPMILLPASCITHLSPTEIEAILVHELAHIRRFDFVFHLFQRAVEILLFFHPGVWWMGSQLRQEREFDCDDVVVRLTPNRMTYARALAAIAELAAGRNSLAMSVSSGSLRTRIQRILGKPPRATYLRPSIFGLGGSLSILGVLLWVLIPRAVAPTQAEESQPKTSTIVVANTSSSNAPIIGFILGPDAKMLAGATVVLRKMPLYGKDQADLATMTTDGTGQFAFEQTVLDKLKDGSDNRGAFLLEVIARKPGYAIRWLRPNNAARQELDLQLVPFTKFSGRLLHDQGEPLAGAMVRVVGIMSLNTLTNTDDFSSIHRGGDSFIDLTDTKPLAAICDINGRFELDELPRRVGLHLVVEDKRVSREVIYAATTDEPLDSRARAFDRLTNHRTPIEIMRNGATRKLDRAIHLRLVFVDDVTGNPVENVEVNSRIANSDVVQRSGTDGEVDFYQIDQRAIVGWTATVTPPANSSWRGGLVVNQQTPTADLLVQHEVRLSRGIKLEGRVIDEASGVGLANAMIRYATRPNPNETGRIPNVDRK